MNPANPFVLGGTVRGPRFAGRVAELDRVRRLAATSQHVFLFAPRRYGKTSLLLEALEPEADAGRLILLWCDCLPAPDATALAQRIAEPVVRAARRSGLVQWVRQAAGLFRRLRPVIRIGADGNPEISFDVAREPAPPAQDLEDALGAAVGLGERKRKRVVVVFDEFQQVATWDHAGQVESAIRTAIQRQGRLACVFAGSQRHLLQRLFTDPARPLFKLAAPLPLGRLSPAELRPWLAATFRSGGFSLTDDALARLLTLTAGHPWATQYLSHFVYEAAYAAGAATVDEALLATGLDRAIEVGETLYGGEFAAVTPPQRRVLTALAYQPTEAPTASGYLQRHRLPAKSTVAQALGALAERGVVEQEGKRHVLADPLFGEWIRRQ